MVYRIPCCLDPLFAGLGSIIDEVADAAKDLHVFAGQPFDPHSDDPKDAVNCSKFGTIAAPLQEVH